MVIRKAEDMMELLEDRIVAMEDLNCQELKECVRMFMLAHTSINTIENAKAIAAYENRHSQTSVQSKHIFDNGLRLVTEMLERIDELTLRDDAAE